MLRQAQMQSDQMTRQMNQMSNNMIQQRMADPQVRAGYQQYVAQMRARGQPAMDYPTYTYNWIYTRGFSQDGIAHARATEAGIQSRERASVQGLREAERQRGAAQQQQRDSYSRNQQEAGRGLVGQSTYSGHGFQGALPHTWQPNTLHVYQGNTYRVDASGQYLVQGRRRLVVPDQPLNPPPPAPSRKDTDMTSHRLTHTTFGIALIAALCLTATAQAQTWEYKSYKRDRNTGGQYNKDNFVAGTISVEEKDGQAFFRMVAGNLDVCYRGALPVTLTKTDVITTIEVQQAVTGCEEFRYTIRNDGSGGFKEVRHGDRWVKSRFDHGLTPSK